VESTIQLGLLAGNGLKWLKYVDPIIASFVTLVVALIVFGAAAKCVFELVSMENGTPVDEKFELVGWTVGGVFFGGLCLIISLMFFGASQTNKESIGYGLIKNWDSDSGSTSPSSRGGEQWSGPGNFNPDTSLDRFGRSPVEVRQPDRNLAFEPKEPQPPVDLAGMRDLIPPPPARTPRSPDHSSNVEVRRPPNPATSPPAAVLPKNAEIALPAFQYTLDQAQKSKYVGGGSGQDFRGHGPAGSVLVGLRLGLDGDQISGLEPIYQLGSEYVVGAACGQVSETQELLLARPGYVVGGAIVAADEKSLSLRLRFVKFDATNGELNTFDQYDSPLIGRSGSPAMELDGKGAMVVGFFGKSEAQRIAGLGFAGLKPTSGTAPAPPTDSATVFRFWFSRDGKFSVEAKLRELKNGKVVLEKRDGTSVEVDPAVLSDEDSEYLKSR
jgi:hypothetical protein